MIYNVLADVATLLMKTHNRQLLMRFQLLHVDTLSAIDLMVVTHAAFTAVVVGSCGLLRTLASFGIVVGRLTV